MVRTLVFDGGMPDKVRPRPSKSWGSRRQGLFFQPQIRIPALEYRSELLIQGFDPHWQQPMRPRHSEQVRAHERKRVTVHVGVENEQR
jgi:hypothetical protein